MEQVWKEVLIKGRRGERFIRMGRYKDRNQGVYNYYLKFKSSLCEILLRKLASQLYGIIFAKTTTFENYYKSIVVSA